VQLQGRLDSYRQAGIGVVALTYDTPALQKKFIDKFAITYPLLSDVGAESLKNLGVLDPEYEPGDAEFGVAYPGVLIVNREQRIVGKIFIEGVKPRVDADGVLRVALDTLR
jgi:peroxiredoxin